MKELSIDYSSQCQASDSSIKCIFDRDTLTISGMGEMKNFSSESSPWFNERLAIKTIIIEDNITTIGDYAFEGCNKLKNITFGQNVTLIGNYAFQECSELNNVMIGKKVLLKSATLHLIHAINCKIFSLKKVFK